MGNVTFYDAIPKYLRGKASLLAKIRSREYQPGQRLPSVTEIAKAQDVSNITARRIMQELVRDGFAYTIPGRGCFVSTATGKAAKRRKGSASRRIVCILSDVREDHASPSLLQGFLKITQAKDFSLEIYDTGRDHVRENAFLNKCLKESVAGVLFIPAGHDRKYKHLFELHKRGIPVVLVDRTIRWYELDSVTSDNVGAVREVIRYLVRLGHKNIAYLGLNKDQRISSIIERNEGYLLGMKDAGIRVHPELMLVDDGREYRDNATEVNAKVKRLFSRGRVRPTAVIAPNDWITIRVFHTLKSLGIAVPAEVSLVGFDDTIDARTLEVPLTTVQQDWFAMGRRSAKLLLQRVRERCLGSGTGISSAQHIRLRTRLIIRQSAREVQP